MEQQAPVACDKNGISHTETDAYYRSQWRAYGLRQGLALFFLYLWVPACVGFFLLSRKVVHLPVLAVVGMVLWLAAALGLVYWAGEFRCPRCRRRYGALGHRTGAVNLTRGIFDKVCSNCKLRKFERG